MNAPRAFQVHRCLPYSKGNRRRTRGNRRERVPKEKEDEHENDGETWFRGRAGDGTRRRGYRSGECWRQRRYRPEAPAYAPPPANCCGAYTAYNPDYCAYPAYYGYDGPVFVGGWWAGGYWHGRYFGSAATTIAASRTASTMIASGAASTAKRG